MSSNKKAREELERLYGKECFIEKLHLRKDTDRKYTSKGQMEKMKKLTYHHIRERRKGGKATVENGALLSVENHEWFHKQSESMQGDMNAIFQEYKRQADELKVEFVDEIETDVEVKGMVFKPEEIEKEYNRAKNRAKEKQELYNLTKDVVER